MRQRSALAAFEAATGDGSAGAAGRETGAEHVVRVIAAGRADPSGEVFSVVDGVVGRLGADAAPALAAAVGDEGADPVTR